MNGTLDLLDTFFGTITGIWGRILSFFLTSWLGFSLGVLAAGTEWSLKGGLQMKAQLSDWYFVPIGWMFWSVATCFQWWGLIHGLILVAFAFAIFYSEANLCQTLCALFFMECWYWWFASDGFENMFGSLIQYGEFEWGTWFPFHTLIMILSPGVAWLWWRSWRNNHPQAA
jgi:hypothetical protein